MAKASGSQPHICSSCGKVTTQKGHLCTPVPIQSSSLAVCDYCGTVASDPRHICFPKRVDLTYFCESCGRVATTRSLLCKPKTIPKPKAAAAKKAGKGAARSAARKK